MLGFLGLSLGLPRLDPLRQNIEAFRPAYNAFWLGLSFFFTYVFALMLIWNLGNRFSFGRLLAPALAVLWYGVAVLMEQSQRNWFVGIRTPWTLTSDVVWRKTHALGGRLFRLTALSTLLGVIFPNDLPLLAVLPAIATALISVVYSYVVYREVAKRSL